MRKNITDKKEKELSYEKWTDEDEALALVALTATYILI